MERSEFFERQDWQGNAHFSALIHWRHAHGPAHCLMQAVFIPNNQLNIFLAELRTCPRYRGIFSDPANAANAAWNVLEDRFCDLSRLSVEWFFRSGYFSSYDLGIPERTSRYFLTKNSRGGWDYKEYDDALLTPEEEARIIRSIDLSPVEADLARLPAIPELDPHES
jgi:hypothetical protein